jgi:hypothetical protein
MMDEGKEYYSREDDRDGAPHAYRPITPITPFLALPDDDGVAAVRVVGIRPSVNDPDVFQFIIIKQVADREAWVATADSISCDLVAQSAPYSFAARTAG